MDEYVWVWMYQSWIQDQEDQHKMFKDYSTFLGSFYNPEMAQQIVKDDEPDHSSDEEDFEKSIEMVRMANEALDKEEEAEKLRDMQKIKHRRRRVKNRE